MLRAPVRQIPHRAGHPALHPIQIPPESSASGSARAIPASSKPHSRAKRLTSSAGHATIMHDPVIISLAFSMGTGELSRSVQWVISPSSEEKGQFNAFV